MVANITKEVATITKVSLWLPVAHHQGGQHHHQGARHHHEGGHHHPQGGRHHHQGGQHHHQGGRHITKVSLWLPVALIIVSIIIVRSLWGF